ncbi:hypothetical protein [Thermomonospora echinospora]|nr:hypothetical protein [Thermomonospora echinospora]
MIKSAVHKRAQEPWTAANPRVIDNGVLELAGRGLTSVVDYSPRAN